MPGDDDPRKKCDTGGCAWSSSDPVIVDVLLLIGARLAQGKRVKEGGWGRWLEARSTRWLQPAIIYW